LERSPFPFFPEEALATGSWRRKLRAIPLPGAVFVPFDFYPRHREELGLNEEQVREMQRIADGLREAAKKSEAERARHTKALQEVVSRNSIDLQQAMECFQAVLNAENELKALQFRGGLTMRNALSPEQFGRLESLATKEVPRGVSKFARSSTRGFSN
jgi:Spy/CpxP family protein refolding chaperone